MDAENTVNDKATPFANPDKATPPNHEEKIPLPPLTEKQLRLPALNVLQKFLNDNDIVLTLGGLKAKAVEGGQILIELPQILVSYKDEQTNGTGQPQK